MHECHGKTIATSIWPTSILWENLVIHRESHADSGSYCKLNRLAIIWKGFIAIELIFSSGTCQRESERVGGGEEKKPFGNV